MSDYHTVVCFGPLAQVAMRYLRKSDRIYVEGRLHSVDRVAESGERRRTVEVIAQHMIMLGCAEPKRGEVVQH
ncbi:MAG: single-stranded DNA-binding protein [bacterium]|nr:single-stranded DNA-binding protein [bacterium]